jgi:heme/copper-type cytochrome/quinol oxidase subunit 3
MKYDVTADVARLPTYRFSYRSPLWWGTLAFVTIEGLGFVFTIAVYFYLRGQDPDWHLYPRPGLVWSSLLTALLILSEIPNTWTKRAALAQDLRRVRIGLVIMAAIGVAAIGLRVFEFTTLNIRWDTNAYGSTLWVLIGLHTTHLVTDVGETLVFLVMIFAGPLDARRFSDVEDNQAYWDFVVLAWLPVYFTMYWAPRWLGSGGP